MSQTHTRLAKGYTLIELLSVIAVLVITMGIALPGYTAFIGTNQQTAAINDFSTSLAQARYNAVKLMTHTILCPSIDQQNCTGGYSWQDGFITFLDENSNRRRDPDERLLNVQQAFNRTIQIQTSIARSKIVFRSSGASPGSNTTFRFCDHSGRIKHKALVLSNTGRVRLAKKLPDGREISCKSS